MAEPYVPIEALPMIGGELCLDFANTTSERGLERPRERLFTYRDLVVWAERSGAIEPARAGVLRQEALARPADAARVHARALQLREALYRVFSALAHHEPPNSADVAWIDAEVREAQRRRRLIPAEDGVAWVWLSDEDALEEILWPVAWSAAELLTSDELTRVRECMGENCNWLFVDVSRNRSRRWCDMKECGNRAKAKRYQARQRVVAR